MRSPAPDDLAAARAWGLALRLCRRLTLCAPEALGNTGLSRNGDRLVLSLRAPAAVLAGDMAERDLKALANHLQLKGSVRIVDHYEPVA